MNPQNLLSIRVKGPIAWFTRPERKVERVSYTSVTPSAGCATENHVIPAFLEMVFDQSAKISVN